MGHQIKFIIEGKEVVCDNDLTMTIQRQPIGEVEVEDINELPTDEFFEIEYNGKIFDAMVSDGKLLIYHKQHEANTTI